ncbi:MAG: hypothetical protein U5R06_23055 [candidate division KSB1 bacterium]|nr:hypothetical protein [candidate division KSB1 bacterium]
MKIFTDECFQATTIGILLFLMTIPLYTQTPNPLRAMVSSDLEEPYNIYEDGGFETGEHDIRTVSPFIDPAPSAPTLERINENAYSGNWCYRITNSSTDTLEFSVWVNPDKAETVTFSCHVKCESAGNCTLKPFIDFISNDITHRLSSGSFIEIDNSWTPIYYQTSQNNGFRYARAGISVPPNCTLYIDNVSVEVPVWKEPTATGTTVGGVNVPPEPAAPVRIRFSIHIEDPQNLVTREDVFQKKTAVFEELARLFHEHGGFLNIQPELEWAFGSGTIRLRQHCRT